MTDKSGLLCCLTIFLFHKIFQGVVSVSTPYFLELFPMEHRDLQAWIVGGTWGFGVMLLSPVAYFLRVRSISKAGHSDMVFL